MSKVAASSIEEALVTKIKALGTVTAYIGTGANARIYFMAAPDAETTMPYIVLSTISAPNRAEYIGQGGGQPLTQLSIFHTHKQDGVDLANALIDGLNHFSGTSDGYTIPYIEASGPTTLKDPNFNNVYQFVINLYTRYDRS